MTRVKPLLFEKYPKLEEKIPYTSLIKKTKVEQLQSLSAELNANLWIKRDDRTTDIYGGNKPRKLEFILADVVEKQKSDVMTMGGTGSNHCLATAAFAKQLGIQPTLLLFHQPVTADVQKKLLIYQSLGAKLLGPYSEIGALLQFLLFKRFRRNTYFLPAGGSSPLGVLGFVNAAFELKEQIENDEMPKPKYLFITCGTLGTMAGLLLGCKLAELDISIIGVRVVQSFISFYNWTFSFTNAVRKLANKALKYLRAKDTLIPDLKITQMPLVLDDFYGEAYGKPTPEAIQAIELVKNHENIILDTTYTGKTFAGLLQYIKENAISEEPVLFWNTYNSQDISKLKSATVSYEDLPRGFQKLFREKG
ncbi:MAG: pyridoxal-phosphate dependent enzyme [Promethearchaeota archaeon]|nr:MAG: pyridoxal-phosphate dependent enzyme [Candidatus Lokiarchaeota archaeon]